MSTTASPRPSMTLSSRRGSASSVSTVTSTRPGPSPATSQSDRATLRRNRAALRDYYNLQSTRPPASEAPPLSLLDTEYESELDGIGFESASYVQKLLTTESLEGVLRVGAGLVSDIRNFDGEKKALVYDNYSKLIAATDTIRVMREKMDPLTPTTSTLAPAIGHIAETASSLTAELKGTHAKSRADVMPSGAHRSLQQTLVKWVLAAPDRIQDLVAGGNVEFAKADWRKVQTILDKWNGVEGTIELRKKCEHIFENT